MTDLLNLAVAISALGIAIILWAMLRAMRPWRQALDKAAPSGISGPLQCVATEMGMLPWVFGAVALGQVVTLLHNNLVSAAVTGLTFAITTLTLWHLYQAYRCVRRAIKGERGA